ncbi:Orf65 [Heliothis zea nudivirus]|uniref:Orf65 n=1 Tax=Heliothis zea nudivirus 1 TaxID=3116536 RepID=Q8JKP6_9VIRU|nr:Orf65 [Heliothis zea nudivirus]AAN04359.1 Orf65 [Heliothis zea nudivirus]
MTMVSVGSNTGVFVVLLTVLKAICDSFIVIFLYFSNTSSSNCPTVNCDSTTGTLAAR